jgi:chromosome segregation ATPase
MPKKRTKAPVKPVSSPFDLIQESISALENDTNPEVLYVLKSANNDIISLQQNLNDKVKQLQEEKLEIQKLLDTEINEKLEIKQHVDLLQAEKENFVKEIEAAKAKLTSAISDLSSQINLKEKEILNLKCMNEKKNLIVNEAKNEIENVNKQLQLVKKDYQTVKLEYEHASNELLAIKQASAKKIQELQNDMNEKIQNLNAMANEIAQYKLLIKKYKPKCILL